MIHSLLGAQFGPVKNLEPEDTFVHASASNIIIVGKVLAVPRFVNELTDELKGFLHKETLNDLVTDKQGWELLIGRSNQLIVFGEFSQVILDSGVEFPTMRTGGWHQRYIFLDNNAVVMVLPKRMI